MKKHRAKKSDKPISSFGFKVMGFMFRFRDSINPPKNFLKEAGLKEGDKIFDYGCGPGGFILPAVKIVGDKGKVYAADIHPVAIKTVERKVKRKNITNVETIQTDCATGLSAQSIDVVLLYDVIHMFNEPEKIFTEVYRVLKPNGILSASNPHMRGRNLIEIVEKNSDFELAIKGNKTYNFRKKR